MKMNWMRTRTMRKNKDSKYDYSRTSVLRSSVNRIRIGCCGEAIAEATTHEIGAGNPKILGRMECADEAVSDYRQYLLCWR